MRSRPLAISLVCAATGLLLVLGWQFVSVYFVLDGETVHPTPAQESRYLWTASCCLAAAVAGAVFAFRAEGWRLQLVACIGVVVTLVGAVVLAVPSDRWFPDAPPTHELPADYEPCFSGSNDCGPGG